MMKKYGVDHPMKVQEFRLKHLRNCFPVKQYKHLEYQGRNELGWLMVLEQQKMLNRITNMNIVLLHPSGIAYCQDFEIVQDFTIALSDTIHKNTPYFNT